MLEKKTSPWIKATLFLICLVFTDSAQSVFRTAHTGQLNLLATIQGTPAFQPVVWRIVQKISQQTITIPRYSAVIDLEAGSYQISVSMDTITKVEEVDISSGGVHRLIINLR